MKKILLAVVAITIVLLGSLAMTKPSKTDHYEAVKSVMMKGVNKKFDQMEMDEHLKTVITLTTLKAIDAYLRRNLLVYESTFYNKCIITYQDQFLLVSVGAWNHPFLTINEDDVVKIIDNNDIVKFLENTQ